MRKYFILKIISAFTISVFLCQTTLAYAGYHVSQIHTLSPSGKKIHRELASRFSQFGDDVLKVHALLEQDELYGQPLLAERAIRESDLDVIQMGLESVKQQGDGLLLALRGGPVLPFMPRVSKTNYRFGVPLRGDELRVGGVLPWGIEEAQLVRESASKDPSFSESRQRSHGDILEADGVKDPYTEIFGQLEADLNVGRQFSILAVVGITGSGKSYAAKKLAAFLSAKGYHIELIHLDRFTRLKYFHFLMYMTPLLAGIVTSILIDLPWLQKRMTSWITRFFIDTDEWEDILRRILLYQNRLTTEPDAQITIPLRERKIKRMVDPTQFTQTKLELRNDTLLIIDSLFLAPYMHDLQGASFLKIASSYQSIFKNHVDRTIERASSTVKIKHMEAVLRIVAVFWFVISEFFNYPFKQIFDTLSADYLLDLRDFRHPVLETRNTYSTDAHRLGDGLTGDRVFTLKSTKNKSSFVSHRFHGATGNQKVVEVSESSLVSAGDGMSELQRVAESVLIRSAEAILKRHDQGQFLHASSSLQERLADINLLKGFFNGADEESRFRMHLNETENASVLNEFSQGLRAGHPEMLVQSLSGIWQDSRVQALLVRLAAEAIQFNLTQLQEHLLLLRSRVSNPLEAPSFYVDMVTEVEQELARESLSRYQRDVLLSIFIYRVATLVNAPTQDRGVSQERFEELIERAIAAVEISQGAVEYMNKRVRTPMPEGLQTSRNSLHPSEQALIHRMFSTEAPEDKEKFLRLFLSMIKVKNRRIALNERWYIRWLILAYRLKGFLKGLGQESDVRAVQNQAMNNVYARANREIYAWLNARGLSGLPVEYPYFGGDASILLSTNAPTLKVYDNLPFGIDVDEKDIPDYEQWKQMYLDSKAIQGFGSIHILDAVGYAKFPLLWELEALGVDMNTVKPRSSGRGIYHIDFKWSFDGSSNMEPTDRSIQYLEVALKNPQDLIDLMEGRKQALLVVKAAMNFQLPTENLPDTVLFMDHARNMNLPGYDRFELNKILSGDVARTLELLMTDWAGYAGITSGAIFVRQDTVRSQMLGDGLFQDTFSPSPATQTLAMPTRDGDGVVAEIRAEVESHTSTLALEGASLVSSRIVYAATIPGMPIRLDARYIFLSETAIHIVDEGWRLTLPAAIWRDQETRKVRLQEVARVAAEYGYNLTFFFGDASQIDQKVPGITVTSREQLILSLEAFLSDARARGLDEEALTTLKALATAFRDQA